MKKLVLAAAIVLSTIPCARAAENEDGGAHVSTPPPAAAAEASGLAPYGQYVVCVTTIDAGGRERPDSYYVLAQDARRRQWQIITEGWGPTLRSPYFPQDPNVMPYPTDSYPPSSIIKASVDYRGDGDICPPDGELPPSPKTPTAAEPAR